MAFGQRHRGQVVEWNDEKGYGFVRGDGGDRLFFHISDVRAGDQRPTPGDLVAFGIGVGRDGRPSAKTVQMLGGRSGPRAPTRTGTAAFGLRTGPRLVVAAALAGAVAAGVAEGQLPWWLPLAYLAMGALSAGLYWSDKSAAQADRQRIPESTLHTVDLLGGIVGGLAAQVLFRHKTAKPSFTAVTAGIVLLHAAAIASAMLGVELLVT